MSPINQVQRSNNALVFAQQKLDRKEAVIEAERDERKAQVEIRKDQLILSEAAAKLAAALHNV